MVQDVKATQHVPKTLYDPKLMPVQIENDGHALYRSVAMALFGDQELHEEVRLSNCIHMIIEKYQIKKVLQRQPMFKNKHFEEFEPLEKASKVHNKSGGLVALAGLSVATKLNIFASCPQTESGASEFQSLMFKPSPTGNSNPMIEVRFLFYIRN